MFFLMTWHFIIDPTGPQYKRNASHLNAGGMLKFFGAKIEEKEFNVKNFEFKRRFFFFWLNEFKRSC